MAQPLPSALAPEIVAVRRDGEGRTLLVDATGQTLVVVASHEAFRRAARVELVRCSERTAA